MEFKELSTSQKGVLITLYAGIILMVIFSLISPRNIGMNPYKKCINDLCKQHNDNCGKIRTQMNCCHGAGGQFGYNQNNELDCYVPKGKRRSAILFAILIASFISIISYAALTKPRQS